ncbi:hypothetical protein Vretifemale_11659, partial [Volvox reticuliferus]
TADDVNGVSVSSYSPRTWGSLRLRTIDAGWGSSGTGSGGLSLPPANLPARPPPGSVRSSGSTSVSSAGAGLPSGTEISEPGCSATERIGTDAAVTGVVLLLLQPPCASAMAPLLPSCGGRSGRIKVGRSCSMVSASQPPL